jgi:hypothetical protein
MAGMSPRYRDPDGKWAVEPTHEGHIERLIREAQERGDFDDLPLHGKPIPLDENPFAGDMALAYTMLRNASVSPPWIEADKDARRILADRDRLVDRATHAPTQARGGFRREMEAIVAAYNAAVARLNAAAPTTRQHRRPMVLADELAGLDAPGPPQDARPHAR